MEFLETCYKVIAGDIILGGAYKTILTGLWVTVRISVVGMFFGLVIGAVLCAMQRCRFKAVSLLAKVYTVIVRGAPVPLILSLLYYVVFAKSDMEAEIIAIIGFALNSAAHFGEIMRTSLNAVDKGQISAARTLGFSAFGAFMNVTLPQSLRFAKPPLQSTMVSIIQWTSVVGTISIADLTRTVNNMGTRTAQPFVALALGILLYLLLAWILNLLFRIGEGDKKE